MADSRASNEYSFDDIKLGMTDEYEVTVTQDMYDKFDAICDEDSMLHTDIEFAKSCGFDGLMLHGSMTSIFYSTFIGRRIPGRYCFCHSTDVKYHNPAYVGDTLKVLGEVVDKIDLAGKYKFIELKLKIVNQNGKIISKAKAKCEVLEKRK